MRRGSGAPSWELADTPERPQDRIRARELGAALAHATGGLPLEQREVFVLAQVEGLRYVEIGEILGIPVGTVKSRMHAAVRTIRAALRRKGFEPT